MVKHRTYANLCKAPSSIPGTKRRQYLWDWRGDLVVKGICCSCRGFKFISHWLPAAFNCSWGVGGSPTTLSSFCGHTCTCVHTYTRIKIKCKNQVMRAGFTAKLAEFFPASTQPWAVSLAQHKPSMVSLLRRRP